MNRPIERRKTALFGLFSADAISITGNAMALLTIPWFVLQITGSPSRTGITVAANLVPTVLASFFGGVLVDRIGRKKISVIADVASGVTVALIPLLYVTVGLEFWQLVALVFLGALLDAPGVTGRQALIPEAADEAGWRLERVTGWTSVIHRSGQMAGPPLAGVLIAVIGPVGVLWINAATFALSAIIVVLGVSAGAPTTSLSSEQHLWADVREGWAFLSADGLLRTIALTVAVTNLLDAASIVVMPVFADRVFGDAISLGLIVGALGGGAVLGALLFARFGDRFPRRTIYLWCFLGVTLWYPVFAAFPPVFIAVLARGLAGVAAGPLNPLIDTVAFERIPAGLRGRVLGAIRALAWMTMPVGALLGGVLIEITGLRGTLLSLGGAYILAVVSLRFSRGIGEMEGPRLQEPQQA